MSKYSGTKLKIMSDGIVIDDVIDCTMVADANMIEVTNKDSNSWAEFLPGKKTVTISGTSDLDSAKTFPASNIWTKISAGTSCSIIFYHSVTGQKSYQAVGYYKKFQQKGGTEDRLTIDFEIQLTGTVTQTATT